MQQGSELISSLTYTQVPVLSFVAALRYGLVMGALEEGRIAYLFWCTNYLYGSDAVL